VLDSPCDWISAMPDVAMRAVHASAMNQYQVFSLDIRGPWPRSSMNNGDGMFYCWKEERN
jgi:hypothetical protein